jgi:hypothetical protein
MNADDAQGMGDGIYCFILKIIIIYFIQVNNIFKILLVEWEISLNRVKEMQILKKWKKNFLVILLISLEDLVLDNKNLIKVLIFLSTWKLISCNQFKELSEPFHFIEQVFIFFQIRKMFDV